MKSLNVPSLLNNRDNSKALKNIPIYLTDQRCYSTENNAVIPELGRLNRANYYNNYYFMLIIKGLRGILTNPTLK